MRCASPTVRKELGNLLTTGTDRMEGFVNQRLVEGDKGLKERLPKCSLNTFMSMNKPVKVGQKDSFTLDNHVIFSRLLIIATARKVKLESIMAYELSAVPISLANADGTLYTRLPKAN